MNAVVARALLVGNLILPIAPDGEHHLGARKALLQLLQTQRVRRRLKRLHTESAECAVRDLRLRRRDVTAEGERDAPGRLRRKEGLGERHALQPRRHRHTEAVREADLAAGLAAAGLGIVAVAGAVRDALDLKDAVLLDNGHAVGLGIQNPLELRALGTRVRDRRAHGLRHTVKHCVAPDVLRGRRIELLALHDLVLGGRRRADAGVVRAPAVVARVVLLLVLGRLIGGLPEGRHKALIGLRKLQSDAELVDLLLEDRNEVLHVLVVRLERVLRLVEVGLLGGDLELELGAGHLEESWSGGGGTEKRGTDAFNFYLRDERLPVREAAEAIKGLHGEDGAEVFRVREVQGDIYPVTVGVDDGELLLSPHL